MSDYETQGYYYQGGRRRWSTHVSGLTLDEARHVYRWFAYQCAPGDCSSPSKARIVHTPTGEIIPPPELAVPTAYPDSKVKTIPVSKAEFDRALDRLVEWGDTSFVRPRRGGGSVYYGGFKNVRGFELEGQFYLRPDLYSPLPMKSNVQPSQ